MSDDLFTKINRQILTTGHKQTLVNFCLSNLDLFVKYPSRKYPGQFSGNDFIWPEKMSPEIQEICLDSLKIFDTPFRYGLGKQDPGRQVLRHTDLRKAVVIIPLHPDNNFAPTFYWKDEESSEPIAQCDYEDMLPSLLNPLVLHSVDNNTSQYRLALQLDLFELSYVDAKKFLQDRSLFSN